jgi:hypothetical protein
VSTKNNVISDRARAKLLARGLSADKHAPKALAGHFPREFNIDDELVSIVTAHQDALCGAGASRLFPPLACP